MGKEAGKWMQLTLRLGVAVLWFCVASACGSPQPVVIVRTGIAADAMELTPTTVGVGEPFVIRGVPYVIEQVTLGGIVAEVIGSVPGETTVRTPDAPFQKHPVIVTIRGKDYLGVSITVEDRAPRIQTVTIGAGPAYRSALLSAEVSGVSVFKGRTLTLGYQWRVNGLPVEGEIGQLFGGLVAKGDVVECVVTPSDDYISGAPVASNSRSIVNAPPTLSAGWQALPLRKSTLPSVQVTARDVDGDLLGYVFTWYVNGASVGTNAATLPINEYQHGDTVTVVVSVSDGLASVQQTLAPKTVENTAPTVPTIALFPAEPRGAVSLWTDVVTDAVDADGDTLTYHYDWRKNGVSAGYPETQTAVAGGVTNEDEEWSVSVYAHDGTDAGPSTVEYRLIGRQLWAVVNGTADNESGHGSFLPDGSIVTGGMSGTASLMMKLGRNGEQVWSRRISRAGEDRYHAVKGMPDGGFVGVGMTNNFNDFSVVRGDTYGDIVWQKNYDLGGSDRAWGVQPLGDTSLVVVGFQGVSAWILRLNNDGTVRWEKGVPSTTSLFDVIATRDGSFLAAGSKDGGGYGPDFYAIKVDGSGNSLWQRQYRLGLWQFARAVTESATGGYYIVGSPDSGAAAWVTKVSESGGLLWQKAYGDTGLTTADDAVALPDGGLVVVGRRDDGGWVARIASDGQPIWQRKIKATAGATVFSSVERSPAGELLVTGAVQYGFGANDHLTLFLSPDGLFASAPSTFVTTATNFTAVNNTTEEIVLNDTLFDSNESVANLAATATDTTLPSFSRIAP